LITSIFAFTDLHPDHFDLNAEEDHLHHADLCDDHIKDLADLHDDHIEDLVDLHDNHVGLADLHDDQIADLHDNLAVLHDYHVDLHDDQVADLADLHDIHDGLADLHDDQVADLHDDQHHVDDLHDDHEIILVLRFLLLHRTLSIFEHFFPCFIPGFDCL